MKLWTGFLLVNFVVSQGASAAQEPTDVLVKFKSQRAMIQYSAMRDRKSVV